MNITEINKIANRKRLSSNADKLREKIAREHKNVIKLKVAQDTAYWDVRERLRQVEGNHEKLQANMVEVQMQHEAISGQYQDELRLRPETLNKLNSTRQICDVLEDYSERLRDTLSRCKADQAALYDAYQQSGHLVRQLKTQHIQAEERSKHLVESLQDKIKLSAEHNTQLLQYFSAEKQKADAELVDVKAKLETVTAKKDELVVAASDLGRKLDDQKHEIGKKEEEIANLHRDIKRLLHEFNVQASEMKNTLLKQEKDLKDASSENESLKQALANQEEFTKSVCDQNSALQEKVAGLEEDQLAANRNVEQLNTQIESATIAMNKLKIEVSKVSTEKEALEKEVAEKNQLIATAEQEVEDLKSQLTKLETEKSSLAGELDRAKEESKAMAAEVMQLSQTILELQARILNLEDSMQECRETANTRIEELTNKVIAKDKELDTKASTIGLLMSQVKSESDACARMEDALHQTRKQLEMERQQNQDSETAMKQQIDQLENTVKNKENELSNQMNIILELRSDKERLQDKIQSMQSKIDNIQKELSGPPPTAPRHPPEHDDNAVMLTPTHTRSPPLPVPQKPFSQQREKCKSPLFAVPFSEPRIDSTMLNFLSDSSMDGDNSLDPAEVNRRFEALSRGERLSPLPVLKRRRSGQPIAQGGLRQKQAVKEDSASLAKIKDDDMLKNKEKEKGFFKNKRNHDKFKKNKLY